MKKSPIFYGYWMIVAAFFCLLITSGTGYYGFPVFYKSLEVEFAWSRGTISLAFTFFFMVQGLVSPFIGRMIDRYGARKIVTLGAIISGLGFLWLSSLRSLWHFYGAYAVVGAGLAGVGYIPSTQIVSSWFHSRRGLALGITTTGVGAGALVMAPVLGTYFIPVFGWRNTYLFLAFLLWLFIVPIALIIIRRPPDNEASRNSSAPAKLVAETKAPFSTSERWTLREALNVPAFWLIAIAFIMANFSHTAAIMHQINHITDVGFSLSTAAVALGALGFGSSVGKFTFGWVCDRIPPKYAATTSYVFQLIAVLILLALRPGSSTVLIWLYAIIMGVGSGGWLPTLSMLTSTNFGLVSYGSIFGVMVLAQSIGTSLGPYVAGRMFDAMQTYSFFFIMLLVMYVLGISAMLMVRRPKHPSTSKH